MIKAANIRKEKKVADAEAEKVQKEKEVAAKAEKIRLRLDKEIADSLIKAEKVQK